MTPVIAHDPARVDFEQPGARHYQLAFHLDSAWGYSLVPLTVINGTRSGPERPPGVAVIGGSHGNEYEGQVAVKRLCRELQPDKLRGRLILIPQLSESACAAGMRCSPLDGVNMNRAFPGDRRGTLSARIAHFVTTCIFPQVEVVLDLHSGGREAVFPICTSFHPVENDKQRAEMAAVARCFDTPFVFVYSSEMASGLLTDEAEHSGKIAVGGEFGSGETVSPAGVRHVYEGVRNVLRRYRHLEGDFVRVDAARVKPPRLVSAPHLADYIPTPRDGVWEPVVRPGDDVAEGELMGRIHDFGDHSSAPLEVRAHRAGVVIALYNAAVCRKGLTLFVIAQELREEE
jgi:predicted deacylase